MTERKLSYLNIPGDLVEFSIIISLVSLILSTMWAEAVPLYPSLVPYFGLFLPLQGLSLTLLALMFFHMIFAYMLSIDVENEGWRIIGKLIWTIVIVIMALILPLAAEAYFGDALAETGFSWPRIETDIPEPPITSWAKSTIGRPEPPDSSTPSGFALRQWIIMLWGLFILHQANYNINKHLKIVLKVFFALSFVYVALARVIGQAHRPMDVGVSMALGTMLFFLGILACFLIGSRTPVFEGKVSRQLLDRYMVFGIICIISFMIISYHPGLWIAALLGFLLVLGVLYRFQEAAG